jgi:hypothetical protein
LIQHFNNYVVILVVSSIATLSLLCLPFDVLWRWLTIVLWDKILHAQQLNRSERRGMHM